MDKELFLECVTLIRRWPRLNAIMFPSLPKHCNFIITSGPGGYKLEVGNTVYSHDDYVRAKNRK